MKDLFIQVADSDIQAVLQTVVGERCAALGIQFPTFEVERLYPASDSLMVKHGAEFTRVPKIRNGFSHVMLVWDHHGSGLETKKKSLTSEQAANQVQAKLNSVSWTGRSCAISIEPELERWLWTNPESVAKWLKVDLPSLQGTIVKWEQEHNLAQGRAAIDAPKELLVHLFTRYRKQGLKPQDYVEIARLADLADWCQCDSFRAIVETLRKWFPASNPASATDVSVP